MAINSAFSSKWFEDGQTSRFQNKHIDYDSVFFMLPNKAGSVLCNNNIHATFETDLSAHFQPITNLTVNIMSNSYAYGSDPNMLKKVPMIPLLDENYTVHDHLVTISVVCIIFIIIAIVIIFTFFVKKLNI